MDVTEGQELSQAEAKQKITNLLVSGEKENVALALQLRESQVPNFGGYCISDLEVLILRGCHLKYMVYKAIVFTVGDKALTKLRCGGYGEGTEAFAGGDDSLLLYILLNDCTRLEAEFSKKSIFSSIQYNPTDGVRIDLHAMNFAVSNLFAKVEWNIDYLFKKIKQIEAIFNNADIAEWYEQETTEDWKPF